MSADIRAVFFNGFAGDRDSCRHRKDIEKVEIRLIQADTQRVAIYGLQPLDGSAVIKFAGFF